MKTKRILALILTITICFSFSLNAYAAAEEIEVTPKATVRTLYQSSPFTGSPLDYLTVYSSTSGDIYHDTQISAIETSVISLAIGALCPAAGVAITVAGIIKSGADSYFADGLYYQKTIMVRGINSMDNLENQKMIVTFYYDAAHTKYAHQEVTYIKNVYY